MCDSLISNIKNWSEGYKTVNKFKSIFYDCHLSDFSIEEIKCYKQELNLAELKNEVIQFKTFISKENIMSPTSTWLFIQENNIIATFPNLNTILRIYLTLPISNASGERSFSVMARIFLFKIHLRSTKIK